MYVLVPSFPLHSNHTDGSGSWMLARPSDMLRAGMEETGVPDISLCEDRTDLVTLCSGAGMKAVRTYREQAEPSRAVHPAQTGEGQGGRLLRQL
ncbi:hypothetical protein SKAU_G00337780 [Synaphobranchus kaupii]|uniref:Uncharacterized protein n=1 Tax=Synaphobranchus kaupii TaxID=118154 RepID=A0A9Q1EMF9_SYNKA|nr:hypothetical protein SKAU_G00337780 [Synaphobranchus kaupii]